MKRQVTFLSLGLRTETVFVCHSGQKDIFDAAAKYLEQEYAMKCDVFVYDETYSEQKQKQHYKQLKNSVHVVFALIKGAAKAAAENENDPLRRVFAYVRRYNKNAVSLMATEDYPLNEAIDYPKDMDMFYYLNCKRFRIHDADFSRKLYRELRRSYRREKRTCLNNLARGGVENHAQAYTALFVLVSVHMAVMGISVFVPMLMNVTSGFTFIAFILILLCGLVLLVATVMSWATPFWLGIMTVYYGIDLTDTSETYRDLKFWLINRAALIGAIAAALGGKSIFTYFEMTLKERLSEDAAIHVVFLLPIVLLLPHWIRYGRMLWLFRRRPKLTYLQFEVIRKKEAIWWILGSVAVPIVSVLAFWMLKL